MSQIKKVLVTGGCGFIGSHVVDSLVYQGYQVNVIDDLSYGKTQNIEHSLSQVRFFENSILDQQALREAAEGCQGIFHLAAHTSVQRSIIQPMESHAVNSTGTLNVLEVAKEVSARVIFSSTASYYGDNPNLPLHEDLAPSPCSHYAAQKVSGEHYLNVYHQIHGVESIALRYFNVYGPRQNSQGGYAGVIKIFKEKVEQGEPLVVYGDGKQTRDFIFVGDVVEANIKAMESSIPYATMNIGTGIATNVNTIAYKTLKILKSENDIVYKPHRPGDPLHCYCNPEKAKNLINFTAKTELDHGMHMALFDHDLIVSR